MDDEELKDLLDELMYCKLIKSLPMEDAKAIELYCEMILDSTLNWKSKIKLWIGKIP